MNPKNKEPCYYEESLANEVIPNLWLGSHQAALDLEFIYRENIKYIIRILDHPFPPEEKIPGVKYLYFPLKDNQVCVHDVHYLTNSYIGKRETEPVYKANSDIDINQIFNKSIAFIKHALYKKRGILVHCKAGHHRSASLVAAFLIKELDLDYITAISYINYLRPCALRRRSCMGRALFHWYTNLLGIRCDKVICSKDRKYHSCTCFIPRPVG